MFLTVILGRLAIGRSSRTQPPWTLICGVVAQKSARSWSSNTVRCKTAGSGPAQAGIWLAAAVTTYKVQGCASLFLEFWNSNLVTHCLFIYGIKFFSSLYFQSLGKVYTREEPVSRCPTISFWGENSLQSRMVNPSGIPLNVFLSFFFLYTVDPGLLSTVGTLNCLWGSWTIFILTLHYCTVLHNTYNF